MRLFAALEVPEGVRESLRSATAPFRLERWPVSWVPPENLHATLVFLGDVPPGAVRLVCAALREGCSRSSPFSMLVSGGGAFPSAASPRVLWAGLGDSLESAGRLQENVSLALSNAGFPGDGKPFRPHVTLARVRAPLPAGAGERFVRALTGMRFGELPVARVLLFESRLSPAGARYERVADAPLGGAQDSAGTVPIT